MAKRVPNFCFQPLALSRHARLRIGLLGGSFNPPHDGHVQISEQLRKNLGLSWVWWLVSPQNPLKSGHATPFWQARLAQCLALLRGRKRLVPCGLEAAFKTRYTIDTIRRLQQRWPRVQFVWLMGADNLAQFHRWRQWRDIACLVPIIVADRAPFSHSSLRSRAAVALSRKRLPSSLLRSLPRSGWGFVHLARHPASSTALRKKALEKSKN